MGLLGGALGAAQWFVLRRVLKGVGWWVLATILGYVVATILTSSIITELGWVAAIKGVLIYGGVPGIFQWVVLRGCIYQAWWWIVISIVGWAVAIPLTNAVFKLSELDALAMLFITTALTGGGMIWLLLASKPNAGRTNAIIKRAESVHCFFSNRSSATVLPQKTPLWSIITITTVLIGGLRFIGTLECSKRVKVGR